MTSAPTEPALSRASLIGILEGITMISAAEIDDTVTFESLDLDSLTLAELLVAVEDETGRQIDFGLDFTPATTIGEAHHTLNSALATVRPSAG
ncbi:acyl carrier protein [Kitasatospora sp. NBC_01287]|uniref:acyl carrier protein n=1 Tax=Kitasatospora sp. NBC_01287 TaxID=2903573 RepID=UPI002253595E|nr:acyl carrier protein [Kitasatospora sp. NBC_01287]MCX4745727.1 acyl carrier protein [Kitasatospora sp. NBC_01287]